MAESGERYQGVSGRRYQEEKRAVPDAAYPWVARLRAAKLAGEVAPQDEVLEYGVGYGWNLAALECRRKLGYDVADFLEPIIRRHGIEFLVDTRLLADDTVDVVICHHTLEHILNPAATLEEMQRVLRPGGRLLMFVPFEKERRYRRFRRDEPNHHLYSWNVQTLAKLIEETGFEVIRAGLGQFGYDRRAAVWGVRSGLGERGFRVVRFLLHLIRPGREVRVVAKLPVDGPRSAEQKGP